MTAGDSVSGEGTTSSANEGLLGSGTIDINITAPDAELLQVATDAVRDAVAEVPEVTGVEHNLRCGSACGAGDGQS